MVRGPPITSGPMPVSTRHSPLPFRSIRPYRTVSRARRSPAPRLTSPAQNLDVSAVEEFHDPPSPVNVRRKPSSKVTFGVQPMSLRMADKSRVWLNASSPAE